MMKTRAWICAVLMAGLMILVLQFPTAQALSEGEIPPHQEAVAEKTEPVLEKAEERPPELRLDISEIDQKSASFSTGQIHTWIGRADIPEGIGTGQLYQITDCLDRNLEYQCGSVKLSFQTKTGMELPLNERYYHVEENVRTQSGIPDTVIRVSLTQEGMAYIAENRGEGPEKAELRIRFQTIIVPGAPVAAPIPNNIHLEYVAADGSFYETDSDIPEVHTGGICLNVDTSDGNQFRLFRESETFGPAENSQVLQICEKGNMMEAVTFYIEGIPKQQSVIVPETGPIQLHGLAYGTYYLVSTDTLDRWDPIKLEITDTSHLPEYVVTFRKKGGLLSLIEEMPFQTQYFSSGFLFCLAGILLSWDRTRVSRGQ